MCLLDEVFQRVDSVSRQFSNQIFRGRYFPSHQLQGMKHENQTLRQSHDKVLCYLSANISTTAGPLRRKSTCSEATTTTSTSSRSSSSRWGCRIPARFFFGVRGFRLKKHGGKPKTKSSRKMFTLNSRSPSSASWLSTTPSYWSCKMRSRPWAPC